MSLGTWLQQHDGVRHALYWEHAPGTAAGGHYSAWDSSRRDDLNAAYEAAVAHHATGLADPPPNQVQVADSDWARTVLAPHDAWRLYVATVAHSLAVELHDRVPWSITGRPADELAILLDSRQFFTWNAEAEGYEIELEVAGNVTLAAPDTAYRFVRDCVAAAKPEPAPQTVEAQPRAAVGEGPTLPPLAVDHARETIVAVLTWCRDHMWHYYGTGTALDMQQTWHYRGRPPVVRTIGGTHSQHEYADGRFEHWTAGCHGTVGFLRAVLRTVNIPVSYVRQATHGLPHFVAQGLWLDHGDDPYNGYVQRWPKGGEAPFPIADILMGETLYEERFGPQVSDAQRARNIDRTVMQLAVETLPLALLAEYCADKATGRSHADGLVYTQGLTGCYTVAELEEQHLWHRLEEKVASLGGCAAIPPL